MSRGGQSFNVKKIVQWVVIITIIIAAIEIPFVYFYFKKEDQTAAVLKKPAQIAEGKNTEIVNHPSTEMSPIIVAESLQKQEVEPINTSTISNDTFEQKPAPVEVKEQKKIISVTLIKRIDSPQTSTSKPLLDKKIMSSAQMQDVVDQLNAKRALTGTTMKCVKIRQTAGSNVSNGFKIADVLKSNGYIISGRETVSSNVKGILVSGGSECLLVTVGSM